MGVTKKKKIRNPYHVWRSMDAGEHIVSPWLTKELADRLAAVLNEIQTDIRINHKIKKLREMPECFDYYYVKIDPNHEELS